MSVCAPPRAARYAGSEGFRGGEGYSISWLRASFDARCGASNGEVSIDRPHEWVVISRSGESGWNERVESLLQTDVWYPEMWRG